MACANPHCVDGCPVRYRLACRHALCQRCSEEAAACPVCAGAVERDALDARLDAASDQDSRGFPASLSTGMGSPP